MSWSSQHYKRSSLIGLVAVITVLVTGCCGLDGPEEEHFRIPEDEKGWFPYSANSQVEFVNNQGGEMTLDMQNYDNGENRWEESRCQKRVLHYIKGNLINSQKGYNIYIKLDPSVLYIEVEENKGLNAQFSYPDNLPEYASDSFYEQKTINGNSYSDVVELNCQSQDSCLKIIKLHYAKNTGLISFTQADSIRWFIK